MIWSLDLPGAAWVALAAPFAVAAVLAWEHRRRLRRASSLGPPAVVARLAPSLARKRPMGRIARVGGAAALATLGFAGPRWGEGSNIVRTKGVDVVLAMDASLSMLADDERPSRLERMRQEVRRYRASSPGDRNALIAFAGRSYILSPLTTDQGAIELYLDNFDPSIVGVAGTALAPTIVQGTQLLAAAAGSASRVLVILSDGEAFDDHAAAIAAAKAARKAGVAVITVGFGTEDGATIPVRDGGEVRALRDSDGQVVITKYDPALLRAVAEASGGEFIAPTDGDRGGRITRALARLDSEQRQVEEGLSRPLHLAWLLVPAMLLLLADAWRNDGGNWGRVRRALRLAAPVLLLATATAPAHAQDPARLYKQGRFGEAAARWRAAIDRGDQRLATLYDLGTALLAADSLDTSEQALERAAASPEARVRRASLFNLGLARLKRALGPDAPGKNRAAAGAVAAYRALLLETPDDADAKWNYELALRALRQGGSGGSRNDSQSAARQAEATPREEPSMSRQQADQLLAAAARDERETQARKQAGTRTQRPPGGKGW